MGLQFHPRGKDWLIFSICALMIAAGTACRLALDAVDQPAYYDVEWSPASDIFAVGGSEGIQIFDQNLQQVFEIESEYVEDVAWNPDGTLLAVVSNQRTLIIVRVDSGISEFQRFAIASIKRVAWSTDGSKLAVATSPSGSKSSLSLYEVDTLSENKISLNHSFSFAEQNARFTSITWDASSQYIATTDDSYVVAVWDSNDGSIVISTDYPLKDDPSNLGLIEIEWHPTELELAVQRWELPLELISVPSNQVTTMSDFVGRDIQWDSNGGYMAIQHSHQIELRDIKSQQLVQQLEAIGGFIGEFSLNPAGNLLVAVGSESGKPQIWIWNTDDGSIVEILK